ncbi:hypothetical protein M407DRAFT_20652 [Tulasnella calospora MUT 4182]|uniref:Long chronological lifespan protein 2 n=1 Tax=Tulasnella calospora MUT 4182 TaxID=1051891 RepID=A0A0C3QFI3_9AGAM|nr:hypothetical protein M407DRAFT_20652 [Tulasnella calospora MUT 4182]
MHLGLTILVSALVYLQVVSAQFGNFFQQAFGGHGHSEQYHQQQSGSAMWAATAAQAPCSSYLCPVTLDCVKRPSECPCPNAEDIKCLIPDSESRGDGTVVCVRGDKGCKSVERKMKP